jgi:endoglucanase
VKVARSKEIPLQFAASPGATHTDMDDIFKSRLGVASALISLPNRYMHTTVEMIRLNELNQIAELMAAFALDVRADEKFRVEI